MKKVGFLSVVVALAITLPWSRASSAESSLGPTLDFYQLDFNLNGNITLNSDWGVVDLIFDGSTDILYFNSAVDSSWQIQNVPVLSLRGSGVTQTQRFWFDLGNDIGEDVSFLEYACQLTAYPLGCQPTGYASSNVGDDWVVIYDCTEAPFETPLQVPFKREPPSAGPMVGGTATESKQYKHKNFLNQQCKEYECVPTAVSNSLHFLNVQNRLNLELEDITIEKMKDACGYDPELDRYPTEWWEVKNTYMETHGLPITTSKFEASEIDKVKVALDTGQDVEVLVTARGPRGERIEHVVCMVGITPVGEGRYIVTTADDENQLDDDEPTKESPSVLELLQEGVDKVYRFTGGRLKGYRLWCFVVECPAKKTAVLRAEPETASVGTPATITVANNGNEPVTVASIGVHRPICKTDTMDSPVTIDPGQSESWTYPDDFQSGGTGANVDEDGDYKVSCAYDDVIQTVFHRSADAYESVGGVGGIVVLPQRDEPGTYTSDSPGHDHGASGSIIAGAIAGVAVLTGAAWYLRRRRSKAAS